MIPVIFRKIQLNLNDLLLSKSLLGDYKSLFFYFSDEFSELEQHMKGTRFPKKTPVPQN